MPTEQIYANTKKNPGTPVVATRAMTPTERVTQLIDAALVMLVELPEAEDQALRNLAAFTGRDDAVTISFVSPVATDRPSAFHLKDGRVDASTRDRLRGLLDQLRAEVHG
ncbi:hypothetical protein GCM10010492_71200 [Saccharothrix mutabilis subsp. mutabilis]|uniref:Uncharacterized protein n=1 Tax=Saccharothrix mutabilis subsp. mutabilis TaxID=66855 RepID=A0ABN0USD7_9PSEU